MAASSSGAAPVPDEMRGPQWFFLQTSRHEVRRRDVVESVSGWSANFGEHAWVHDRMQEIGSRTAVTADETEATEQQKELRLVKTYAAQAAALQPFNMVWYLEGRPVVVVEVSSPPKSHETDSVEHP